MLFDVFFQKYVEVLSGKKYNNGLFYAEFLEKEIENTQLEIYQKVYYGSVNKVLGYYIPDKQIGFLRIKIEAVLQLMLEILKLVYQNGFTISSEKELAQVVYIILKTIYSRFEFYHFCDVFARINNCSRIWQKEEAFAIAYSYNLIMEEKKSIKFLKRMNKNLFEFLIDKLFNYRPVESNYDWYGYTNKNTFDSAFRNYIYSNNPHAKTVAVNLFFPDSFYGLCAGMRRKRIEIWSPNEVFLLACKEINKALKESPVTFEISYLNMLLKEFARSYLGENMFKWQDEGFIIDKKNGYLIIDPASTALYFQLPIEIFNKVKYDSFCYARARVDLNSEEVKDSKYLYFVFMLIRKASTLHYIKVLSHSLYEAEKRKHKNRE